MRVTKMNSTLFFSNLLLMKVVFMFFVCFLINGTLFAQIEVKADVSPNSIIFFQELFEDDHFEERGWYDAPGGAITVTEHNDGDACFECRLLKGSRGCERGSPSRHLFAETDEVYVSYWVKYSSNWEGSNKPYHPHEFMILTNENNVWCGPAYTHLTAYIEQNEGEPLLSIQDGENIDESNINVDLTELTEDRAVAGCNGDSDGYGNGECYPVNSIHRNGKSWKAGSIYFQDTLGAYYKNDWHLFAFCY